MASEHNFAVALQWICFGLSFFSFGFYTYKVYKKECGWEVIYIGLVESIKYLLEILWENESPATLYVCSKPYDDLYINGTYTSDISVTCAGDVVVAPWLRYAEWLLTCPVILIALSNLSGLKDDYNFRTMKLLSSDQGTIVMGVTAAYSTGGVKGAFFTLGLAYGMTTFYTAFLVYAEAYENVPVGKCKTLVSQMAYMFYVSWLMFPTLFLLGPEGAGHLSNAGSVIAHTFADLISKNLWGFWSLFLRQAVRDHHRNLYKEEQERERLGLSELVIPKEARPNFNESMNSLLLQQFGGDSVEARRHAAAATIEETVDPFYAEYRRKRRQRRGSLSGNADEDEPIGQASPMPPMPSVSSLYSSANKQPGQISNGFNGSERSSINLQRSSFAEKPFGKSSGNKADGFSSLGMVVILDSPNSEFGNFYGEKLEAEFNLRVNFATSPADLQANIVAQGNSLAGVLFADHTLDAETVAALRRNGGKPFVAYGTRSLQASGLPADDYLRVPQMGVPYDHNELSAIVQRHFMPRGGSGGLPGMPPSPFSQAAPAPNKWQATAAAANVPAPTSGKANIDRLLADIAKLKTTLSSQHNSQSGSIGSGSRRDSAEYNGSP
mmetsp:Transcript_2521/g.3956  ORF Transcript_2521/g.3956 Transcript_2521/m.3956 type:complete len:609 (+) Transcript_2521:240-2066(+)